MAPSWRDSACMYSTGCFCDNGDLKKLLRRATRLEVIVFDKLFKLGMQIKTMGRLHRTI